MKRLVMLVVVFFVLYAFVFAQSIYDKADQLWLERDGTAKSAREGLKMLEEHLANNPDDFEALWRAARFCFWVCDRADEESEAGRAIKREFGQKGYQYAEKIIAKWPNMVEGYYYYTINLGEYGKGIGKLKAIKMGLAKKFEQNGEKAVAIDKRYEQCGPLRAMGRFYFSAPWPVHNAEKSIKYLKDAIQLCPNKVRSHAYLAETLIDEKRYEEARQIINQGLSVSDPVPTDPWEDGFYRQEMRKMLEQIKGK